MRSSAADQNRVMAPGVYCIDVRGRAQQTALKSVVLASLAQPSGIGVREGDVIVGSSQDSAIRRINITTKEMRILVPGEEKY